MTDAILRAEGLRKAFGAITAVDGLDFAVHRGELFAFLGQNGAGKSTTILMLIGQLRPDGGQIYYEGSTDFAAFKPGLGVVFQHNAADDLLTVRETLRLYRALYGAPESRAQGIIERLALGGVLGQRFKTLSGGQKRKVEIARALLTDPKILFLDEPTTGLDPRTRAEVWQFLAELRRETGMTVFLTTHYMEETAQADQVLIIHKGREICRGTPAELKAAYASDRLLLTPADAPALEAALAERGIPFTQTADTYAVPADDTEKAIALLHDLKGNLRWFESVRGTMDEVFLNAVGENIGGV
jgi:multidrug/hemolysin transport system ATP-binding protein